MKRLVTRVYLIISLNVFTGLSINTEDTGTYLNTNQFDLPANGGKIFSIQPKSELTLALEKTERSWRYVIFQAHSLYRVNLVSKDPSFTHESTDKGSSASVLLEFGIPQGYYPFYLKSNYTDNYNIDVISIPYQEGAPFPGGCCLTCNMDIDPNIKLTYTQEKSTLIFPFANVFYKRGKKAPPCDGVPEQPTRDPLHFRLRYDIYQRFLPEGDLSEGTLFKELIKMAYPEVIKTYGTKVTKVEAPTVPHLMFDTLPGQGVIYNIIVVDPTTGKEAAYSPTHTYGCSFTSKINSCESIVSVVNKVLAVIGAAIGLAMCFCGHRLFKITLFLGGLVNVSFIFFIILSECTDLTYVVRMVVCIGIGVFGGLLVFTFWWFTEYTRLCLLLNSLFLGFLVAGCLFFSPVGQSDLWQSDFDYGVVIVCVTAIVPFLMLPWPKVLSIVYTSVVSAYGIVLGVDVFLRTSISYIVLNIVIRAVEPNYSDVIVIRPFQANDIILSSCWGLLSLLGIASQFYTNKSRAHFPRSGYLEQKRVRKYLTTNDFDEQTPILINTQEYSHNNIC